jgi:SAM-dependent methyltransferase
MKRGPLRICSDVAMDTSHNPIAPGPFSERERVDKLKEIYDNSDDALWQRLVYEPLHAGWHLANIGGRGILDFAVRFGHIETQSHVLDMCCGSGDACLYVARNFGCSVTGVDANESQIARARRRLEDRRQGLSIYFVTADVRTWKPERAYDLVYSLDSFGLIPDLSSVLRTSLSALRTGGSLVLADVVAGPNITADLRRFMLAVDGIVSLPTVDEYVPLLSQAGFQKPDVLDLTDLAERSFEIIHRTAMSLNGTAFPHLPGARLVEWRELSARYRNAFASRELRYIQINTTA